MKIFQNKPDSPQLGPLLREARLARKVSLAEAAASTHLSEELIESLEEGGCIDPRRARLHAVTYARFLGLDLGTIRPLLPPLPELTTKHQLFLSNAMSAPKVREKPFLEMLAPMGKLALYLMITVTLLGLWGMIRQLSRVRSVPWVTTSYSIHP